MTILALSDIHDCFAWFDPKTMCAGKNIDLIIIAGDITNTGETKHAKKWIEELNKYAAVFWIPGNHDLGVKRSDTFGDTNILNEVIHFNEYSFLGLSMSPCYDMPHLAERWDHMTAREDIEKAYYELYANQTVDIVLSHCPPYSELSEVADGVNIGSKYLLEYIKKYQPKIVICGHCHQMGGEEIMIGKTRVINVATKYQIIDV